MGANEPDITERIPDITLNHLAGTLGEEHARLAGELGGISANLTFIIGRLDGLEKRLDHADEFTHGIARGLATSAQADKVTAEGLRDMAVQVAEIHAEVQAAKPLLERWQHGKIRGLAATLAEGRLPWQT